MKPFFIFLVLIGLGNAVASDLDFTLSNETKRSFEAVYISASDDKDWDGNVLTRDRVLEAGGKLDVRFPQSAKSATWDLRVVDDEGFSMTFKDVDLEGARKVTLKPVNGKITAEVE